MNNNGDLSRTEMLVPRKRVLDHQKEGIAFACTQALHSELQKFQQKLNEIKHLHEQWKGLVHWLKEEQRGVCQLAEFLRSLGGDQAAYWHTFEQNALRHYHLTQLTLRSILDGTFDLGSYVQPLVSSEPAL